jgi:hypothetical protein
MFSGRTAVIGWSCYPLDGAVYRVDRGL